MKAKFLFGTLAALMVTACSQDEVLNVNQDGIAYSVAVPSQTRAANSYCNNTLPNSFKVWALTNDGALYINGDVIERTGATWTDKSGTHYWPEDKTLDFYAQVNGDNEFDLNGGSPLFNGFTVKDNVRDQVDLIYSVKKAQSKNGDGKVELNFRHALSQVCFKAKNNTKTMQVSINRVSVGHLTNTGSFAFPTSDTDENYVHHNDNAEDKALNGGIWSYPTGAQYNKQYDVTPLVGTVTLYPGEGKNLTCPGDEHANTFEQVLTLLPQTVEAWDPTRKGADWNGAYFLVNLTLSNITMDDNNAEVVTTIYSGDAAIPVSVAWEQGYRYIYTFVFDEGGNGGYTPDPSNPQPILTSIKYDITVDDFIPVNPDGGNTGMDTGNNGTYSYSTILNLHSNYGEAEEVNKIQLNSNTSPYSFTLTSDYTPTREGYRFLGWADTPEATTATYSENASVSIDMTKATHDLYAIWEEVTITIVLSYDAVDGTGDIPSQSQTVKRGEKATFTVSSIAPTKEGQYRFLGWSYTRKTEDGKIEDVDVQAGTEIQISESTTLYAIYGKTTPTIGGGGSGSGWDN